MPLFTRVRGTFAVHRVKLLILCSTNRVPLAYELTAANAADVPLMLKVMYASVLVEPRASDDRCVEIGPR